MAVRVADGGYLGWCYGSSPNRWEAWSPLVYNNQLLAMDRVPSLRNLIFEGYKARRGEMRAASEAKTAVYDMVHQFVHERIYGQEEQLHLIYHPGLEADDIIALLAWKYGISRLLAIDKDLLQLAPYITGARLQKLDGEEVTLESYKAKKLPKTLSTVPFDATTIPLLLSLLGDKSDSVPRLVPPGGLMGLQSVLKEEQPYKAAYREYGQAFLQNILITVLPLPLLFGFDLDRGSELIYLLDTNRWRPEELWEQLDPQLQLLIYSRGEYNHGRNYSGNRQHWW
jgi:hypothetical protein